MTPWQFLKKSRGILGMNARNLHYIFTSADKKRRQIADSKILTKEILKKQGLPLTETFGIVSNRLELPRFDWETLPNSFVLKPNAGLAGSGIVIVFGRQKKPPFPWITAAQKYLTPSPLKAHVDNILEGNFSLYNLPDKAIFEERVKIHPVLKPYCFRGIPDIRVVVYNLVPAMAMLRLPTKESGGRANLHLGAIGVGIDLGSGITTHAFCKGRLLKTVPQTRLLVSGIKIPHWAGILKLASKCQKITKINFLGVDIALDKEEGPKILELNARPGLSIQIANLSPLRERLKRIEGLTVESTGKGVDIGQSLFGGATRRRVESISGKKVIGVFEPIKVITPKGKEHPILAKIDTGAYSSSISEDLAKKLKLPIHRGVPSKEFKSVFGREARQFVDFTFLLKKEKIKTRAALAKRAESRFDVLIGRRDLKGKFLINPARKRPWK